jgi:hypothetical protein
LITHFSRNLGKTKPMFSISIVIKAIYVLSIDKSLLVYNGDTWMNYILFIEAERVWIDDLRSTRDLINRLLEGMKIIPTIVLNINTPLKCLDVSSKGRVAQR